MKTVFSLLAAFLATAASAQAPEVRMTWQFSPVRMTYTDIQNLTNKVDSVIKKANSGVDVSHSTQTLVISDGTHTLTITGDITPAKLAQAPPTAYSAEFTYYSRAESPITIVQIQLRDYRREIEVSGQEADQVEALVALVRNTVEQHQAGIGGPTLRGGLEFSCSQFQCLQF
jgi:hypothetical protein